jgi:DNA-binding SARP family transcriptional activator
MSTLRIRLFGGVHLSRDERPLPAFPTQRARALFVYLALNRGKILPREVVMGVLWADEEEMSARRSLRTAIWRVRSAVDRAAPNATPAIVFNGHEIGFNTDGGHWLDVEEFERLVRDADRAGKVGQLAEKTRLLRSAIELYRGDALEGMYDDWCLYERERLRLLNISAMESLFRAEQEQAKWASAIEIGQRLLRAEPLREHVHRELMMCHLRHGNRPAALRQYEECSRVLNVELGIEPMDATRQLLQQIRSDHGSMLALPMESDGWAPPPPKIGPLPAIQNREPTLSRVHRLLANVDEALEGLRDIRNQLEDSRTELREMVSAAGGQELKEEKDGPGTLV